MKNAEVIAYALRFQICTHMTCTHTAVSCKNTHRSSLLCFHILCNLTLQSLHQELEPIFPPSEPELALQLSLLWPKEYSRSNSVLIQDLLFKRLVHFCCLCRDPRLCHVNKLKLLCWHVRPHWPELRSKTCKRIQPREGKLFCNWPQMNEATALEQKNHSVTSSLNDIQENHQLKSCHCFKPLSAVVVCHTHTHTHTHTQRHRWYIK